ncbi:unnamed protein product, partial [Prorocentrum cordatum]
QGALGSLPRRLAAAVVALASVAVVAAALPFLGAARHEGGGLPDRAPRVELDAAARGQAGAQALIEAAARATKDAAQQETTAAKGRSGPSTCPPGTLVRYFPNLDRHVVAPLARSNRTVDVYLSLSVEGFISWRSHGNRFVMHPAYVGKDLDEVKDMIVEGIRDHGGTAAAVR